MVELEHNRTEQQINSEILGLFNSRLDTKHILDEAVGLLTEYLKCEALGIRVMDGQGNIPYQTYRGFSDGFIKKESPLCIRHDKCACIEIVKGEYNPSVSLYTTYGSFYTNRLQSLEPVREGMKSGRFRGECVRSGWGSLMLVPIRFAHKYFGLIHAVDGEEGRFPVEKVRFVENIAGQMALYMHALEAQAERENEFSSLVRRIMHDLKSPLFSTKIFAELITSEHSGRLNHEAQDLLERISRNADYMEQLIAGLSGFAQAYSPEVSEKKKIDLNEFIRTLVSDMGLRDEGGVRINISGSLPVVDYPPLCLKRILTNLLSNAKKFSCNNMDPAVEIACQEKDMFYQVSVADNGMGMDSSEVGRIFDPFYRTEEARDIPGTGLGLSICRKLVEKYGGKIWVFSDKGKGSTFYFTVPK